MQLIRNSWYQASSGAQAAAKKGEVATISVTKGSYEYQGGNFTVTFTLEELGTTTDELTLVTRDTVNNQWKAGYRTEAGNYITEVLGVSGAVINDEHIVASKAYAVVATLTGGTPTSEDIAGLTGNLAYGVKFVASAQATTKAGDADPVTADATSRLHKAGKANGNSVVAYADGEYADEDQDNTFEFTYTLEADKTGREVLGYVLIWFDGQNSGNDVLDTAAPTITLNLTKPNGDALPTE